MGGLENNRSANIIERSAAPRTMANFVAFGVDFHRDALPTGKVKLMMAANIVCLLEAARTS